MKRQSMVLAAVLAAFAGLGLASSADAGQCRDGSVRKYYKGSYHCYSQTARRGTRVKGYVFRSVGGYSYNYEQSINTYGDARPYGSSNWFRDRLMVQSQTPGGPFDSGFFFATGVGTPHGGDSPYMH